MVFADQEERDAAEKKPGHLFITASAGTGKSTSLARKITHLVIEERLPLKSIAAITFTRKAANELKWKIERELKSRYSLSTPAKKHVIEDALDSMDEALFGTIHSFCAAMLRRFGSLAGIDPDFSIIEEDTMVMVMNEALDSYAMQYWHSTYPDDTSNKWLWLFTETGLTIAACRQNFLKVLDKVYLLAEVDVESMPIRSAKQVEDCNEQGFLNFKMPLLKLIEHYDYQGEILKEGHNSFGGYIDSYLPLIHSCQSWSDALDLSAIAPRTKKRGKQ